MWNRPIFQKLNLASGGVLVVKMTAAIEIGKDDLPKWQNAATCFEEHLTNYRILDIDLDTERHVIAGLIWDFGADEFHRTEVVQWGAFVGLELSEQDVSNALSTLSKESHARVGWNASQGPGARWKVEREALRRYLKLPA